MDNPGDTLYQIVRFLFAGSLLLFLYIVIKTSLRELQESSSAPEQPLRPFRLVVLESSANGIIEGESFRGSGRLIVGRSSQCGLRLEDPSISAEHALLLPGERGWLISDLNSRNGTFVGGVPVDGPTEIYDGDLLQMGRVRLKFLC
jgi:pSer/pThr/pTyr-binding forkhead associated (FHA) protein